MGLQGAFPGMPGKDSAPFNEKHAHDEHRTEFILFFLKLSNNIEMKRRKT
jgi:hypothetical protein